MDKQPTYTDAAGIVWTVKERTWSAVILSRPVLASRPDLGRITAVLGMDGFRSPAPASPRVLSH